MSVFSCLWIIWISTLLAPINGALNDNLRRTQDGDADHPFSGPHLPRELPVKRAQENVPNSQQEGDDIAAASASAVASAGGSSSSTDAPLSDDTKDFNTNGSSTGPWAAQGDFANGLGLGACPTGQTCMCPPIVTITVTATAAANASEFTNSPGVGGAPSPTGESGGIENAGGIAPVQSNSGPGSPGIPVVSQSGRLGPVPTGTNGGGSGAGPFPTQLGSAGVQQPQPSGMQPGQPVSGIGTGGGSGVGTGGGGTEGNVPPTGSAGMLPCPSTPLFPTGQSPANRTGIPVPNLPSSPSLGTGFPIPVNRTGIPVPNLPTTPPPRTTSMPSNISSIPVANSSVAPVIVSQPAQNTSQPVPIVVQQPTQNASVPANASSTSLPPVQSSSAPGPCQANHTYSEAMTAGFDDAVQLNVNIPDLNVADTVNSIVVGSGISINGEGPPMTYKGLSYSGFTTTNSSFAVSPSNILFARPGAAMSINITSPTVAFNLEQMSLGCDNSTTPTNTTSTLTPVPSGLGCQIHIMGTAVTSVPGVASPSSSGGKKWTELGTTVGAPLSTIPFDASTWSDLASVQITAQTVDGAPVGLLLDNVVYQIQGAC